MPLRKGKSRDVIQANIHELVAAGHKPDQAVAIALHTANPRGKRKGKRK